MKKIESSGMNSPANDYGNCWVVNLRKWPKSSATAWSNGASTNTRRKIRESKEIIHQRELTSFRKQLREEVKKTGMIEAVYKLALSDGRTFWLKDQAEIERYPEDQSSISLGCLTVVSKEMEAAEEREKLVLELQEALSKVKQLSGLLPICASCKKIRDDQGYWNQIEEYIRNHSEADFSHGLCPPCIEKLYPDFVKEKGNKNMEAHRDRK